MKWFQDLPIRRKLTLALVIVGTAAVLMTGCLRIVCDVVAFHGVAIDDLSVQAQIIGDNCAAALEFNNPQAALETLASLNARSDIVGASIHRNDGTVLADYHEAKENFPRGEGSKEWIKEGHLLVQRPVVREGEVLGMVHLRSNLRPHYKRLLTVVGVAIVTMLVSTALAIALSLRLQRVLSVPILNLARVAKQVTEHEDYTLRVAGNGNDEIGMLTDRFNHMLATIQERDTKLRHLSAQVLQSQDGERRRIARELHDVTGQKLVGLGLALDNLKHSAVSLSDKDRELLTESGTLVQQCTQELRTLSYLLYPPLLDDLGLAAALESYVQGFMQRANIRVEVEIPTDLERFSRETELALFRVLQESLSNIQRHAGSSEARIRLRRESGKIIMEIQDAGKGFAASAASAQPGVGILSMRERLGELGGELTLQSNPDGTTVRAVLPITSP